MAGQRHSSTLVAPGEAPVSRIVSGVSTGSSPGHLFSPHRAPQVRTLSIRLVVSRSPERVPIRSAWGGRPNRSAHRRYGPRPPERHLPSRREPIRRCSSSAPPPIRSRVPRRRWPLRTHRASTADRIWYTLSTGRIRRRISGCSRSAARSASGSGSPPSAAPRWNASSPGCTLRSERWRATSRGSPRTASWKRPSDSWRRCTPATSCRPTSEPPSRPALYSARALGDYPTPSSSTPPRPRRPHAASVRLRLRRGHRARGHPTAVGEPDAREHGHRGQPLPAGEPCKAVPIRAPKPGRLKQYTRIDDDDSSCTKRDHRLRRSRCC